MKFDRAAPCGNCPFLKTGGILLSPARIGEIAQSILVEPGSVFPCHQTINYNRRRKATESACAGSLLFLQNLGVENTVMQVARRFGLWQPTLKLKGGDRVFRSLADWLAQGSL